MVLACGSGESGSRQHSGMEAGRKVYESDIESVDDQKPKRRQSRCQPDEKGLLPNYGCTRSGKACDRCKKYYRQYPGNWRYCSNCLIEVRFEIEQSDYLQPVPVDYRDDAMCQKEEDERLAREIRHLWGDDE